MGALPSLRRTWVAASEPQQIERILAGARAFMAVASLITIWINPTEPSRYAHLVFALLAVYALEAIGVLAMVRTLRTSSLKFRVGVHAVDILWPALMSVFTAGPNSPFYIFYTFVLLEAAYRWGMQGTLVTALATTVIYSFQGIFVALHIFAFLPPLEGPLGMNGFMMRAGYLLLMGYLMGYLGEEEKQLREEVRSITRIMTKVRAEIGVRNALRAIFDEIFKLFRTRHALLALLDHSSDRAFVWDVQRKEPAEEVTVSSSELKDPQAVKEVFETPGHVWHMVEKRPDGEKPGYDVFVLDEEGRRIYDVTWTPPQILRGQRQFHSILGVCVGSTNEWSGTLFLFNPKLRSSEEGAVRFLRALALQVSPAVYGVFLMSRLRSRAGAIERARVARELHDGVIQSLIGLEMEIDVLRRQPACLEGDLADRMGHIQRILRQEVVNLRELMQQMKPVELRPTQLLDFLATTVDKFGRDTGISSRFVSTLGEVSLPSRVCNQVARIVQEALVNARKHSGAQRVLVQLGQQDGHLRLVVDDDGKGFDFSGRLALAELDTARRGPIVIKERVRSIGGELVVESLPGKGSRLEITLPQRWHA
ncbi:MAG: sensor histidine kinase [Acidobacteria bacterium]|nr:sensor histidine kinase [Acidobacteriota bacterium]